MWVRAGQVWSPGLLVAVMAMLPQSQGHVYTRSEPPSSQTYFRNFTMPGVTPKVDEAYLCTAVRLNETVEEWVVKFDPLASANRAHHMLLFGCSDVMEGKMQSKFWDCGHHGVCRESRIMYAWAKNAPTTTLPSGVGFRIGGQTGIRFLTLQIHYAHALPEGVEDYSGLQMEITQEPQKYKAGIYLLAAGNTDIPPRTPKTHADMNCLLADTGEHSDINLFAYRVHAHALGTVITGYLFNTVRNQYTEIAKGNPQWPQAFYPMNKTYQAKPTDILHARCTWDSTTRSRHTLIGSTAADEMCNLYLMYYTDPKQGSEFSGCGIENYPIITKNLPPDSDVPLPPNPLLEEHAHGQNLHKEKAFKYSVDDSNIKVEKKGHSHQYLQGYESPYYDYMDDYNKRNRQPPFGLETERFSSGGYRDNRYPHKPAGFEYEDATNYPQPQQVLQRWETPADPPRPVLMEAPRKAKQLKILAFQTVADWKQQEVQYGQVVAVALNSDGDVVVFHRGERSWDGSTFIGNTLRNKTNPIASPTLLHLERNTGHVINKWGKNFFFVPHGLTLDGKNNIWVTDVGLHQIFKFPAGYGNGQPLLTLGTRFEPGNDGTHFCKPTGVAVMSSGEFFVSDGYCNARIIKYSADGKVLNQFGEQTRRNIFGIRNNLPAPGSFNIPHALTLADNEAEVCVADRENGRVQCFTTTHGKFARQFKFNVWGNRLFSLSYTPASGGRIFAVNGPSMIGMQEVKVYEVDFSSGEFLGSFSPKNEGFSNPHDIAVSSDGREVYVAEIGPNTLWKFVNDSGVKSQVKPVNTPKLSKVLEKTEENVEAIKTVRTSLLYIADWSSARVSTVVLGLLTIPVIVLAAFTLIIRAHRTGRLKTRSKTNGSLGSLFRSHSGKHEKGLIGSFINNHHGFEKIATEDFDHDVPDSGDSDIEEFSQVASRA